MVRCDEELRLHGEMGRRGLRRAGKPIAAEPPLNRAASVFMGHGLCLSRDQRVQCFGGYNCAPSDTRGAQFACFYGREDGTSPQAGRLAGLSNTVSDLRRIVLDGLH